MARTDPASPNFADYFTIGEAAEFLGVSAATLRNWDRSGKLKPRRHPQNGYRIYLHEDLAAVLHSAQAMNAAEASHASDVDWQSLRGAEHFVQFYESDAYLAESAGGFVAAALRQGGIGVVVATAEHRRDIEIKLAAHDIDVGALDAAGRYVVHDARETLLQFMVDDRLDTKRFESTVGQMMTRLSARGGPVHAFGEMVALLWEDGNREGAIALEQQWNALAQQHKFALLCAYPIHCFDDDRTIDFDRVCACHTRVQPAESYAAIEREDARLEAVCKLQHQVHSLRAEIVHRQEVENSLRFAECGKEGRLAKIGAELRMPLAAIQAAVDELSTTSDVGSTGREAAELIRHQIARLNQRISRLL
jgi:DNA-binding transcriptional MerR regulator